MEFSTGDRVIVSEVPEVKRDLRGRECEITGFSNGNVLVKLIAKPKEKYTLFPCFLRKAGEPFGANETERRVKYLSSSGVKCPFCDTTDISASPLEGDAGTAWADVVCRKCGNSWRETYELVHYEEVDRPETGEESKKRPANVVIEVSGGVADVTRCPEGVEVEIIDHDNRDEEEVW